MTLSAGDLFADRYRLEVRLGAGGLAGVWRATDTQIGTTAALKRFTGALASADAERLRADVELLAAHALGGHPNVVEVYGGGSTPEPHVVMEYLDGGDLSDELASKGQLTIARTLELGTAVADALAAAAEAGIIHGDLKPSNILEGTDGAIKLSDFNVAKVVGYTGASVSGTLLLSFAYAALEVWDGKLTSASDLYALGCVLYECLTGVQPFTGTYTQVFRGHIDKAPDLDRLPANVPPELKALLADLLAKDPAQRPASAQAVVERQAAIRTDLASAAAAVLPVAFGPWHIEEPHPSQPLAWRGRDASGRTATLEVVLGDKAMGDQLHHAADANPQLTTSAAAFVADDDNDESEVGTEEELVAA